MKAAARDRKRILLVDDYPSTGHTFRITFDLLNAFGIRSEQIAVLAPTHTAQPKWTQLAGIRPPIQVFTIHPDDLYKMSILNRAGVARLCSEYFGADGSKARVVMILRLSQSIAVWRSTRRMGTMSAINVFSR